MSDDLPTILFKDAKAGEFIVTPDLSAIFEMVPSGRVMHRGYGGTLAPDKCVMKCYWSKERSRIGEVTIDYFQHTFYGPYDQERADEIIKGIKEAGLHK